MAETQNDIIQTGHKLCCPLSQTIFNCKHCVANTKQFQNPPAEPEIWSTCATPSVPHPVELRHHVFSLFLWFFFPRLADGNHLLWHKCLDFGQMGNTLKALEVYCRGTTMFCPIYLKQNKLLNLLYQQQQASDMFVIGVYFKPAFVLKEEAHLYTLFVRSESG